MKLSKIYKRYTLVTLSLVLMIGSLSHYGIITYFIHRSADHTLKEYRENTEHYIREHDTLIISDNPVLSDSRITAVVVDPDIYLEEYFRDTLVYSPYKKETVVFRLLSYTLQTKNDNYMLTLWQATVDTEDVLWAIGVSLLVLFILFALFSLWWTKWFVGNLWHPFYQILEQLKEFDLLNLHTIKINKCRVDEFNTLNGVLNRMLDRIQKDYISLRELTETTSHELQTPLSIVKARLELLQQNNQNSMKDTELIQSVSSAVDRVIRLNRFMLTIVKINNDQFPAGKLISINNYIDDFLQAYEDMIEMKNLKIQKLHSADLKLYLHPLLAEMLTSNILSNAIRYNIKNGHIRIQTTDSTLSVTNPYNNIIPAGDLFARFNKSGHEKEATGLGLAIVKSICEKNNLDIRIDMTTNEFHIQLKVRQS